jgi:hypothetical protein
MKICSKNHTQIVFDDSDNPEGANICPLCYYVKLLNDYEWELKSARAEIQELIKKSINFFY